MAFGQATFNKVNRHIFEWLYALEAGNPLGISQKVTFWRCIIPDSNSGSGGGMPFPNIYIESWCITVLFIRRIYRIREITYCVT